MQVFILDFLISSNYLFVVEVYTMLRKWLCEAHMGRFLALKCLETIVLFGRFGFGLNSQKESKMGFLLAKLIHHKRGYEGKFW